MKHCFHCRQVIELEGKIGRRETCPGCGKDLHVCRNCRFYDAQAYNACREPQAERVMDKDRSNFCDYFVFREEASNLDASEDKPTAKDRLAALFK